MNSPSLESVAPSGAAPLFNVDWFEQHIPLWETLRDKFLKGRDKFLEIGSFEGRSACWMIEHLLAPTGTLYCVDTWEGSPEFWGLDRNMVQQSWERFHANVNLVRGPEQQVIALKNRSTDALAGLIHLGHLESFDLIYIDGSHRAPDALTDACMAFPLLKRDGLMVFDDYSWDLHNELTERPKMAVDAFVSLFHRELRTVSIGSQYVVQKQ